MLTERGLEKIEKWLPKGYIWEIQFAERKSKKERAMGGMLIGRREEIKRKREDREEEDILADNVLRG